MISPKAIVRKLGTFLSLGDKERSLVLEATLLPPFISAGIKVFGASRTQNLLQRWAAGRKTEQTPSDPWAKILLANKAQRRVMRATGLGGNCLTRSLTLWFLLLRRGLRTDLRVGFRRREGKVEGHAWIEFGGVPLNDEPDVIKTYSAFKDPFIELRDNESG